VVKTCARWKIGLFVYIPVFYAPWLRDGVSISSEDQPLPMGQQAHAHMFIKHENHMWNHHLEQHCFDHATTQSILNAHLFPSVVEDEIIWKKEKTRHYMVKNVCCFCLEEIADNSYLQRPDQWTSIWKLKLSPKVKNLIW